MFDKEFFDVDAEEIYKTLQEDIPLLTNVLEKIKDYLGAERMKR